MDPMHPGTRRYPLLQSSLYAGLLTGLASLSFFLPVLAQDVTATRATDIPRVVASGGYVGAAACRTCHPSNHASWRASYHRSMTQWATPSAVLAPVGSLTPVFEGRTFRLDSDEQGFLFTAIAVGDESPDRDPGAARRVVMTTGSHHYQVYWLEGLGGQPMAPLPLVWHLLEQRWVPRSSLFLVEPGPSTWNEAGRWRSSCIKCHSTHGIPATPPEGDMTVAELGISCEACHGPGADHVKLRRLLERNPANPEAGIENAPERFDGSGTIVNPARLSHVRSSEICGQCHAVRPITTSDALAQWKRNGFAYRPGEELAATRPLVRGRAEDNRGSEAAYVSRHEAYLESRFWPDGVVRVAGREFNGLAESACFQRGEMGCLSCHQLHPAEGDPRSLETWRDDQLAPGARQSAACLACHAELAAPAARAAHSHHPAESSGADCLNCHMPFTTFGLAKAIRNHTILSPDAAVARDSGRISACNQCHLDRSLGWTADHLRDWYGQARPQLTAEDEGTATVVLHALEGNAAQRALAAWSLGWEPARQVSGTAWMKPFLGTLAMDPYDVVRWIAIRSLRRDPAHAALAIDYTLPIEVQRNVIREEVVQRWRDEGVGAAPESREAVLLLPDATLDEERFLEIFARRDHRVMRIEE